MKPHAICIPAFDATDRTTDSATLAAEICARLLEWRDTDSATEVSAWLIRAVGLYRASPNAFWLYVQWQTGDLAAIGRSYGNRAKDTGVSRQAVEQATARAMAEIERINPELAHAMRETFESVSPEAHAERYRHVATDPNSPPTPSMGPSTGPGRR